MKIKQLESRIKSLENRYNNSNTPPRESQYLAGQLSILFEWLELLKETEGD